MKKRLRLMIKASLISGKGSQKIKHKPIKHKKKRLMKQTKKTLKKLMKEIERSETNSH